MVMRLFTVIILMGTVVVALLPPLSAYAKEEYADHKVIAVYIYNFLHYVSWPTAKPAVICTIEDSNVGTILQAISEQKNFTHKALTPPYKIEGCAILYLDDDGGEVPRKLLQEAIRHHILTVSTIQGFIHKGGIIGLIYTDNRIAIEINLATAHKSALNIDSEILELAVNIVK